MPLMLDTPEAALTVTQVPEAHKDFGKQTQQPGVWR